MIKMGIIEENVIMINNYEQILTGFNDIKIVFKYKNIINLKEDLKRISEFPDIILVDIKMPYNSAITGINKLNLFFPKSAIILLSSFADYETIDESLKRGVKGFVTKSTSYMELHYAIKSVMDYGGYLSPAIVAELLKNYNKESFYIPVEYNKKDAVIIQYVVKGLSYKEVANELNISVYSVNQHLKKIYKKEKVRSKGELIYKLLNQKM